MKRLMLGLIVFSLVLLSCGLGSWATEKPLNERIVGKWSGLLVNKNGDKLPAEWEFLDKGTMVIRITTAGVSYGGTWSAEGNRINFTTEANPEEKNYREVEFVSDDVVKLTKESVTETFSRIK